MTHFAYDALDSQGELRRGVLEAESAAEAAIALGHRGLNLQSIHVVDEETARFETQRGRFLEQLGSAWDRRQEWLPALDALSEEILDPHMRRETKCLADQVRSKTGPRQILGDERCAALLPLLSSGVDSTAGLQRLHEWVGTISEQRERRERRLRMLTYPAVLVGFAALILIPCALFLVPIFAGMFAEFGLSLPAPTAFLVWLSDQLRMYWLRTFLVVVAALALTLVSVWAWRRNGLTNRLLGVLVSGSTGNLTAMAIFCDSLAELLSLHAPLSDALRLSGQYCRHPYFAKAADELASWSEQPAESRDIASLPVRANRFPATLLYALQLDVGAEPSTSLLRELGRIYREQVVQRMDWIAASLPTVAMLLIGSIIGFVVIALFMPLVSMVTSLA